MAVSSILKQKGSETINVAPDDKVSAIIGILAEHKIGAVLVLDKMGVVLGIISERDVVRVIAQHSSAALSLCASDIMTKKVRTCSPDDTEIELMGLMTAHRIRHLPVVQENKLVGLVSIGDVVKLRIANIEREAEDLRLYIASAG